jgi:hypothetical protein
MLSHAYGAGETMADSGQKSLLLDPSEAAELLGVTVWTLERWRRQALGPTFVRLGPANGGSIRYHQADLAAYLEARRVEPVDVALERVLDSSPELAETVTHNAAHWRKTIPVIFDALAVVAMHDPGSLAGIVEAGNRGEKIFRVELPDVPDLGFVEIVGGLLESEIARRERLHESSRRVRGGLADPWAAARIVDIQTWRLLERTLTTGVKWLEAKRCLAFRLRRGNRQLFSVFKGAPIPLTEEIFTELLENSADFPVALGRGEIREIARLAK